MNAHPDLLIRLRVGHRFENSHTHLSNIFCLEGHQSVKRLGSDFKAHVRRLWNFADRLETALSLGERDRFGADLDPDADSVA